MRNLSKFLLLFLLTSCSSLDNGNLAPGYSQAYTALKNVIFGYKNKIDPNIIANIPYASMVVRIGKGPQALMILESIEEENYTWVSADEVYLITRNGIVIKTYGLHNNLVERVSSFKNWKDVSISNQEFISYLSFDNPELNNLKTLSTFKIDGSYQEQLMFSKKKLTNISEQLSSSRIGWREENLYWIDENEFVWKSVQHISPKLPPLFIEVTKKPR